MKVATLEEAIRFVVGEVEKHCAGLERRLVTDLLLADDDADPDEIDQLLEQSRRATARSTAEAIAVVRAEWRRRDVH